MKNIKSNIIRVVLLEDNPIDVLLFEMMLSEKIGKYQYDLVGTFETVKPLLDFIETNSVDIILSDIFTKKEAMGLELLKNRKIMHYPIVLITSSHDRGVYSEAQQIKPVYYLIKPIHAIALTSVMERAIDDYKKSKQYDFLDKKFLRLIGRGGQAEQILLKDIIYVESEGNNCIIHAVSGNKYVKKKSLSKMLLEDLGNTSFIRVHQRYIVNKLQAFIIKYQCIKLSNEIELPIGKNFRKDLLAYLKNPPNII